ncbi:glycerophosphoryl diester phosphodiesterase membrane domain-containing protein [Halobaculum sp. P14]|uniref:glycerophosphoryl diester phosphodiesterase membrane domain-containing protein n=1 Tax=Halobaculum sp. P14 TaxID=3421638 RepID=UPI003EBB64F3
MSPTVDIGDALTSGVERLATRGGAILAVLYVAYQLVFQVFYQSAVVEVYRRYLPADVVEQSTQSLPFALDIPLVVSIVVVLLAMVGGVALSLVALRALHEDIDQFPTATHTRRLAAATGVGIVVNILTFIAVFVGLIFLFVPGLYIAISLMFALPFVALEDAGITDSLSRSWELATGHRWRLFFLGIILAVIGFVIGLVPGILSVLAPAVGQALSSVMSGVTTVFSLAVLVTVYEQLTGGNAATADEPGTDAPGALGPDDLDA